MSTSKNNITMELDAYHNGDIVWVTYRKTTHWPAKITHIYSKEKKASYMFLPLQKVQAKNYVFKANPKDLQPFTENDPLPKNAKPDLIQAYEAARELLLGSGPGFAPDVPMEKGEKIKKAKAEPKVSQKQAAKKVVSEESSTPVVRFKSGDIVIVDSIMGMWPALFDSFNPKTQFAKYSLFPRNDPNHQGLQEISIKSLLPFPKEELEENIEAADPVEQSALRLALLDVKDYLNSVSGKNVKDNKKQMQPSSSKERKKQMPTSDDEQPKAPKEKTKPTKAVSMEVLQSTEKNAQKRKLNPMSEDSDVDAVENPPKQTNEEVQDNLTKTVSTASEKKQNNGQTDAKRRTSPVKNESTEPVKKKLKQTDDNYEPESVEKAAPSTESVHQTRSKGTSVEKAATDGKINKKPIPAKKNNGAPSVTKKSSLFSLAISEKSKEYITSIWSGQGVKEALAAHKDCLNSELGISFDFGAGHFLSISEVEKLVDQIQEWIKSSTNLPKMSMLKEMHYISKFVLPELCAYAISQDRNSSMDMARIAFAKDKIMEGNLNGQIDATAGEKTENGLEHLVTAAEMQSDENVRMKNGVTS